MKIPLIQKSYTFHRFNEYTNTIEVDHDSIVTRHMTPAEIGRYRRLRRFYILGAISTALPSIVAFMLMLCALGDALPDWWAGVGGACLGLMCIPLQFVLNLGDKIKQLLEKELPQIGFEDKDIAHKSMEGNVKAYAEAWRAAHPLEEKIRIAKETGNCVDIAELVRYCGADLADKLK